MAATYDEAEKRVYGGLGLVTAPADLFTANTISNNVGLHNVGPTTGLRNGLNLRRNLTLTRETGLPLLYIASGLPLPSIPGGGGVYVTRGWNSCDFSAGRGGGEP